MKIFLIFFISFFYFTSIESSDIKSLEIGSELLLSEVKMKNINGKVVSIKDVVGKNGVLVMFSCNTCPWVIKNQSRTNAISEYAKKKNVGVIVINSNETQRDDVDSFEEMLKYSENQKYSWPYVIDADSKVADAYGATKTPEIFLFNSKNKLVYKGAIDDNPGDVKGVKREHLKSAIDEMIEGKDVTVKESRSMGCSIKRKSIGS